MIDRITAELHPRNAWESLDLGLALSRRYFVPMLFSWLTVWTPVWVILAAVTWNTPLVFFLLTWWFKPMFARVPLWVLSQLLFALPADSKTLRRNLMTILFRGNLFALTLGRCSLWRSFIMPVRMLEEKRQAGVGRLGHLLLLGSGTVAWATVFFFMMNLAVLIVFLDLLNNWLPNLASDLDFDFGGLFKAAVKGEPLVFSLPAAWLLNLGSLIAMTLTELFYIGAGFGVYLNSRSHMEGWDIQVAFRQLCNRLTASSQTLGRMVIAALIGSLLLGLPNHVHAETNGRYTEPDGSPPPFSEATVPREDLKQQAEEILKHQDFTVHTRQVKVPQSPPTSSGSGFSTPDATWLLQAFKVLLWLLAAAALLALLWFIVRFLPKPGVVSHKAESKVRVVAGLDLSEKALPKEIVVAARAALLAGNTRECLRLLYAGALRWMVGQPMRQLCPKESDTEADCLLLWAGVPDPSRKEYFRNLTQAWIQAAYSGRKLPAGEVASLIDGWGPAFEARVEVG